MEILYWIVMHVHTCLTLLNEGSRRVPVHKYYRQSVSNLMFLYVLIGKSVWWEVNPSDVKSNETDFSNNFSWFLLHIF